MKSSMKNSMIKEILVPVAVLMSICLVISAALALTNELTAPVIAAAEKAAADEARKEVLPAADSFTAVVAENLPPEVTEVYRADNGAGYVIQMSAGGYGGAIKMICGIDASGNIAGIEVLSHSETKGIGDRIEREDFKEQFLLGGSDLSGVQAISGATISSSAYIAAVRSAVEAYKMIEGGGGR